MIHKTILILFVIGLLSACGITADDATNDKSPAENSDQVILFDRLIGLWENEDSKSYERWTKNNDGSYLSVGFQIVDSDTVYAESVYVHRKGHLWISENTVPGQNEGKAIKFTVTKLTHDEVNFNNPAHDFPTDIHYLLEDDHTIHAYIAGPSQSGGRDTIPFSFVRVAN